MDVCIGSRGVGLLTFRQAAGRSFALSLAPLRYRVSVLVCWPVAVGLPSPREEPGGAHFGHSPDLLQQFLLVSDRRYRAVTFARFRTLHLPASWQPRSGELLSAD